MVALGQCLKLNRTFMFGIKRQIFTNTASGKIELSVRKIYMTSWTKWRKIEIFLVSLLRNGKHEKMTLNISQGHPAWLAKHTTDIMNMHSKLYTC